MIPHMSNKTCNDRALLHCHSSQKDACALFVFCSCRTSWNFGSSQCAEELLLSQTCWGKKEKVKTSEYFLICTATCSESWTFTGTGTKQSCWGLLAELEQLLSPSCSHVLRSSSALQLLLRSKANTIPRGRMHWKCSCYPNVSLGVNFSGPWKITEEKLKGSCNALNVIRRQSPMKRQIPTNPL